MLQRDADEDIKGGLHEIVELFESQLKEDSYRRFLGSCTAGCFDKVTNGSASLMHEEKWSMEETRMVCGEFDRARECYTDCEKRCDPYMFILPECGFFTVMLRALALAFPLTFQERFCFANDAQTGIVFCVRKESLKIQEACTSSCAIDTIAKLTGEVGNMTAPAEEVNTHTQCDNMACVMKCMRSHIDEKCPNGGQFFTRSVRLSYNKQLADAKVPEGTEELYDFASAVSSIITEDCKQAALTEYAVTAK